MQTALSKTSGFLMGADLEGAKRIDMVWRALFTLRLLLAYPLSLLRQAPGIEAKLAFFPIFAIGAVAIWPWTGLYDMTLAANMRLRGDRARRPLDTLIRVIITVLPAVIWVSLPDENIQAVLLGLGLVAALTLVGLVAGWHYLSCSMDVPPMVTQIKGMEELWTRPRGWRWVMPGEGHPPEGGWDADAPDAEAPSVADLSGNRPVIHAKYSLIGYLLLRD